MVLHMCYIIVIRQAGTSGTEATLTLLVESFDQ